MYNRKAGYFMFITDYAVVICTALLYLQSVCTVSAMQKCCGSSDSVRAWHRTLVQSALNLAAAVFVSCFTV